MQPNLKATYSSPKHANSSISKNSQPKRKKWAKGLNGCIFKEGIEMAIKAREKMLSITVREMPIKLLTPSE